jgi:16S rRNA processing protein RimM
MLARILRPRGNKGEVAVELLTDFPERLKEIREVFLRDGAGKTEPQRASVKAFWTDQNHRGQAVYHFEGCASISEAEQFRGMDVLIPFEQRVTLPAGKYFVSDLVGCSVFESAPARGYDRSEDRPRPTNAYSSPCSMASAPALVGTVSDVQMTGENVSGTPLLVIDTGNGELLIPLAEDICTRIDPAARRIEVVLPEGLRDLNLGA